MKIVWTEPAVADLTAVRDYIARDSERYARQFVSRIIEAVERLESFPEMGRRVPEAMDRDVREVLFQAYRIIYRVAAERVEILSVLHGSRELTQQSPKPWEVE
jgi:addiction module RelE/StbE family toxin